MYTLGFVMFTCLIDFQHFLYNRDVIMIKKVEEWRKRHNKYILISILDLLVQATG